MNPPKAIEVAVDKYLALFRLSQAGLAVPRTCVCQTALEAMEAFERLGGEAARSGEAGSLRVLAALHVQNGEHELALANLNRALNLSIEIGARGDEAVILEGSAEKVTDAAFLDRFADAYKTKYEFRPDLNDDTTATGPTHPELHLSTIVEGRLDRLGHST